MAPCHQVYDSHHMQGSAGRLPRTGISSGTLLAVEYGLPFLCTRASIVEKSRTSRNDKNTNSCPSCLYGWRDHRHFFNIQLTKRNEADAG